MKRFFGIVLTLALLFLGTGVRAAQKDTLRILAIGNSFSWNAVEQNLSAIALADGKCAIIGNMYIGGCSLERHIAEYEKAKANPEHRPYGIDRYITGKGKVALKAVKEETDKAWASLTGTLTEEERACGARIMTKFWAVIASDMERKR